ncbi:phospholipase C, phosphocholine-specific [Actinospica sp. MGRD01-02]|uniref:phospholipase C n=1 Tax=Actinospica acidithermotolerans TaxID=2828514 RepID=A0A941EBU9_9ACTN|nr:phospholipase C, phosphocholine-specific [Actinospica acidithermotolerans]MBR7827738.1 phospholipase C, phosphocholine-specific [Actinospica acidithermotolerans]
MAVNTNRRRFIQLSGGAAAASILSTSIAKAASIPATRTTGTIKDVEHIVVLMQENRSFDHYFGTLRGVRGYGDPRPVTQPSGQSVFHQPNGTGTLLPFHPTAKDLGLQFLEDLAHDWNSTHEAWNGGAWNQWIAAKGTTTMAYLDRDDIPFHYALADAFTVCDAYHCSMMGPTDPNRYYMWTGYVGNDGQGGGPVLDNAEAGYDWSTYPERLEAAGVSWKVYQDVGTGLTADGYWGWTSDAYIGNYGDNSLLYFHQYQNAAAGTPLADKAKTGTDTESTGTLDYFDILKADVRSGNLPQVSYIVAPEAFCEHPNWPANYGAWYIAQVLEALTADPDVWSKTALFITFDENDGFFDHVVPPVPPTSAAKGASTVDVSLDLFAGNSEFTAGPYGLGPRVPMLVVSPWSTGGYVNSEVFDHTSIIRFIEKRFGVSEPNVSDWRRTVCGDLTSAFDFSKEGCEPKGLPSTSAYVPADRNRHASYVPAVPTDQSMPVQEPGLRLARPLPYNLAADAKVTAGQVELDFANLGSVGAVFHVVSSVDQSGPWDYTVSAGKKLAGTWAASAGYAFEVHGPNGFLREANGSAASAGLDVTARHLGGGQGEVLLSFVNHGETSVEVTLADAYGNAGGHGSFRVRAGGAAEQTVRTNRANGWYDVSVTASTDSGYLRRFAGHVENGRPSTSDPAIATS